MRKAVASELILALDARIQRIKLNRNIEILVVLALFMVAVFAMWSLIRSLVDAPLQTLTKSMLMLASGETIIPGGDCGCRDAIGDMSRALTVFQDNAMRKAALKFKERQSAIELEAKPAALAEAHQLGRIGHWSANGSDDRQV